MRDLLRSLPLVAIVLLIPILPFVAFGAGLEASLSDAVDRPGAAATAALVVAILASDIFLPVPSSVVATGAGWALGWVAGSLAVWLGLSLGACLGFWAARRWGRPLALRFSSEGHLERMEGVNDRYGPAMLAIMRAVPVFAEASVLLAGTHRLSWRKFLPVVLLSNLGVALAFAAFGDLARQAGWLPLALAAALGLPAAAIIASRRLWAAPAEPGSAAETFGRG